MMFVKVAFATLGLSSAAPTAPSQCAELSLLQTQAVVVRVGMSQEGVLLGDALNADVDGKPEMSKNATDKNYAQAHSDKAASHEVRGSDSTVCRAGQFSLVAGRMPAVEHQLKIVDNATATVENLVNRVNDTTHKVVSTAINASKGLSSSLLEAKFNADGLKVVLGENIAIAGSTLLEKLSHTIEGLPIQLANSEVHMQAVLANTVAQFNAAGEVMKERIHNTAIAMGKLENFSHGKVSLLQQTEASNQKLGANGTGSKADGIIDWLAKTFGNAAAPCRFAAEATSEANKTVDHLGQLITNLNTTLCANILDASTADLQDSIGRLKGVMKAGADSYAEQLPKSFLATVDSTISSTQSAVEKMQLRVRDFEVQVTDTLLVAHRRLYALHDTFSSYSTCIEEVCTAA